MQKKHIGFYNKLLEMKMALAWHFRYAPKLEKFKDIHKDEDCFIIGNGPSLNKMDLTKLNGYHLFGLNKINLLFKRVKLHLSYHVSVNRLVIEQSLNEFKKLPCPSFLSYQKSSSLTKDIDNISFILTSGRPYMFQTDLRKPVCEGNTVTYVAIQIAFYMGFKQVFLIGVDHNFNYSGQPNEKQFMPQIDLNHFDPDYFKGKEWHTPDLEASELAFHLADFHFKRDGRKIYDATIGGKLNIFEKISFEESLLRCHTIERCQ